MNHAGAPKGAYFVLGLCVGLLAAAGLLASTEPGPTFETCKAACAPVPILAFEAGRACYCGEDAR